MGTEETGKKDIILEPRVGSVIVRQCKWQLNELSYIVLEIHRGEKEGKKEKKNKFTFDVLPFFEWTEQTTEYGVYNVYELFINTVFIYSDTFSWRVIISKFTLWVYCYVKKDYTVFHRLGYRKKQDNVVQILRI